MKMIPSPQLGFFRRVFLANHLASNDNLTSTTKRQNTYQWKLTIQRGPNKLRHKTETGPGLVTLYDIQPGNSSGLFLQPRSPHEAQHKKWP